MPGDDSPGTQNDVTGEAADAAELVPQGVRSRVMSVTRIGIVVAVVTVGLIAALSAAMATAVTTIFGQLTPVHESSLQWKAERGIAELARTTDLGIPLGDPKVFAASLEDFELDEEVAAVVVQNTDHADVYRHQKSPDVDTSALFKGDPLTVREVPGALCNWGHVELEGGRIGRVGIVISTHQLAAGLALRQELLRSTAVAVVVALLVSLAFVRLYITPLVGVTRSAFLSLEERTRQALEAARVKSEFLANVSHELRTPLNAILGTVHMLQRTPLNEKQQRYANISQNSAQSLLTLINDVLDFSKLEAGKFVLNPTDQDVRPLVEERMELLAVRANEKQLDLVHCIGERVPQTVELDGDRFRQVLTNLVGNAVKFTSYGEVVVRVGLEDESEEPRSGEPTVLRVTVRDTGPGIEPEQQARLFQSFSQLDGSSTRTHGGTGLGLSISRELVELMGGQIGVESTPGEGAMFWFTVACKVVRPTPPHSLRPRAGTPTGLRMLVADPSPTYRELIHDYAERWGMVAVEVAGVEVAIEALSRARQESKPFDVALVEARLDPGEGHPVAQAFRDAGGEALRLIYLGSGLLGRDERPQDVAFVGKPLRASELYDSIVSRPSMRPSAPSEPMHVSSLPAGQERGRVLVVDDNAVNLVVAEEILRELGYDCDTAAGGEDAIDRVKGRKYDAVLMDCQMPGMNGYEATHALRQLELGTGRRMPIIALTANAFKGEAERARAADMDDFLSKPVSPRVLDATLLRWIQTTDVEQPRDGAGTPLVLSAAPTGLGAVAETANDTAGETAPGQPGEGEERLREQRRSARLIDVFSRNVPEQMRGLLEACQGDDVADIRARSHKLKGSAGSIGAMRLFKLCEAIQFGADAGDIQHAPAWSTQAAEELDAVLLELNPPVSEQSG